MARLFCWASAHARLIAWATSLGLLAVAARTLLVRHVWRDRLHFFWDLKVYVGTIQAPLLGLDPYGQDTLGNFGLPADYLVTTPPMVTWLLGLLGAVFTRSHVAVLLGTLHLGALAATVVMQARLFFGRGAIAVALAAAAYFGMFAGIGMVSLGAANLGTIHHAAIIAALVPGLRQGRWRSALAVVFAASLFKPFYLAYLIFPVAAHGWNWRMVRAGVVLSAATGACYLVQAWVAPEAFRSWLTNIHATLVLQGDIGLNLLGARALAGAHWTAFAIQAVAIGALAVFGVFGSTQGRLRWAVLLVVALFTNPRIMPYDLTVAAVPLAFVCASVLRRLAPETLVPLARLALAVGGIALLHVSAYYPSGIDPHIAFPVTALVAVALASWPLASPRLVGTDGLRQAANAITGPNICDHRASVVLDAVPSYLPLRAERDPSGSRTTDGADR